jgi:uracil-DNA glycosylase family 4
MTSRTIPVGELAGCRACPRLAAYLDEIRGRWPIYHARPVAAFGDPQARLLIVGLAPGLHGANRTGRPFTGDHAGILLYETLHRFGFASAPTSLFAGDGLRLTDCLITNAVKCVPPQNKPEPAEVQRCNAYLRDELSHLPRVRVILTLGAVAHRGVLIALGERPGSRPFAHGARHALPADRMMLDSYHCSRYNTQTRRLTPQAFAEVFAAIRGELDRIPE